MIDLLKKFLDELPTSDEKLCFEMGYDCEINGANEKNCHFTLFSSPEKTAAWEAGKAQAVKDREKK
jgi:hypothetical protein